MKHNVRVTLLMLSLFVLAQLMGLLVVNQYIDSAQLKEGTVSFEKLPFNVERPEVNTTTSFTYIFAAIILGTLLLLLFIRLNLGTFWKFWFFLSMVYVLTVSFSVFLKIPQGNYIAASIAAALAAWRLLKPNFYVHNFTEVFIYGGLAAIVVPLLNIISVIALLVLISIYDMYAVWKSKHMIKLARFTAKEKVFAGMLVQYREKGKKPVAHHKMDYAAAKEIKSEKAGVKHAILGGGDIGFPLIFAGVVMKDLMLKHSVAIAFLETMFVVAGSTAALAYLFWKGEKGKFYPAMPYLSIGCLVGWLVVVIIESLI
ncbi:hypothetical protein HYV81_00625 [Candidatus Woesearchaeota archaeon]|nr:hypothetical protein [Candidatus Woesearchaeota archaeon]